RTTLDRASRQAPEDDRVWLARANLAIHTGQFAEAKTLLEACGRRRPDDPAVWQASLDWALAADRVDEARRCLDHLPADRFTSGQISMIQAGLAVARGDAEAERQALERAVEADPSNLAASDRLVELAIQAGQAGRAELLRRRKAELDRAKHRYRNLYKDGDL